MTHMTRNQPPSTIISLREAMQSLFEESTLPSGTERGMASNLYETADLFVLQLALPGVNQEQVQITAQQETVQIAWETSMRVPENTTMHWGELPSGQYQQRFTLPATIDAERAEATYEQGILTLILPKAEQAQARQVKVQTKTPALV